MHSIFTLFYLRHQVVGVCRPALLDDQRLHPILLVCSHPTMQAVPGWLHNATERVSCRLEKDTYSSVLQAGACRTEDPFLCICQPTTWTSTCLGRQVCYLNYSTAVPGVLIEDFCGSAVPRGLFMLSPQP